MPDYKLDKLFQLPDWEQPPKRVVSLVPSLTASLFELGFGESVVGVTDFCTRPAEKLLDRTRVGGTRMPDIDLICELKPDLVIVNQEENSREAVEGLLDRGLKIWMVFPKSVEQSIDVLRSLLALFHTDKPVIKINTLQMAVDYAAAAAEFLPKVRYFCPIWLGVEQGVDWYMTFNADTYMDDLLRLFGGENVFAERERRFPLAADIGLGTPQVSVPDADRRYPCVSATEVVAASPELILVPDDPYKFSAVEKDKLFELLKDTPAVKNKNVHFIDGTLITWDGVQLGAALQRLAEYFA